MPLRPLRWPRLGCLLVSFSCLPRASAQVAAPAPAAPPRATSAGSAAGEDIADVEEVVTAPPPAAVSVTPPVQGQTSATDSPRERGRVLQKRNPLASEYQAPGTLGRSPGAQTDGESNDYRALFAPAGSLLGAPDLTLTGAFVTLQSVAGTPEPGADVRVRRSHVAPGDGGVSWSWDVKANVTTANRLIEHYESAWAPVTEVGADGRYLSGGDPVLNADGEKVFFLERARVSQDAIDTRTRTLGAHVEVSLPGDHRLFAQATWSDYADDYFRHRIELNFGTGLVPAGGGTVAEGETTVTAADYLDARARRYFAHTITERDILRLHAGGQSPLLGGRLDYGVYHGRWHSVGTSDAWNFNDTGLDLHYDLAEPERPTVVVTNDRDLADLSATRFNDLRASTTDTLDLDWAGRADYERAWTLGETRGWFTLGALHRQKERTNDPYKEVALRTSTPLYLASIATEDAPGRVVHEAYTLPQALDPNAGRAAYEAGDAAFGFSAAKSALETYQDRYNSQEEVEGGYVSLLATRGPWEVEAGLRRERTHTETLGTVITPAEGEVFGPEIDQVTDGGVLYSVQEAPGENRYSTTLPTVAVARKLGRGFTLRAAGYEQLMRPQYFDIVASRRINEPTRSGSAGSPDLRPTSIRTAVVALEGDHAAIGTWGLEFYATEVEDFFYNAVAYELVDGEVFSISRVTNGSTAKLRGFQVQWSRDWHPGGPLVLDTGASYTYSDSEAHLPTRPDDVIPLPERSRHLLRAELGWKWGTWSGGWELTAQSAALDEVGPSAARDDYRGRVFGLDGHLAWRPTRDWRVQLRAQNLTDAPERGYTGETSRITRHQYSGTVWRLGVERTW